MDRERVALEGCYNLQMSVRVLMDRIGELSPIELATARCDPEGPPALRALAEQLDDCRTRLDALRRSLRGRAARDPRFRRVLCGRSPLDN
jgi:hypothetical protein